MGGFTYKHHESWGSLRGIISGDLLGKSNGIIADAAYLYPFELGNWSLQPGIGAVWENKSRIVTHMGLVRENLSVVV